MVEEQFPVVIQGKLTSLAVTVVQVRGVVSLEREKRRTMTQLADRLSGRGQIGQVTHRDPSGGEWTITLGPVSSTDDSAGRTCW